MSQVAPRARGRSSRCSRFAPSRRAGAAIRFQRPSVARSRAGHARPLCPDHRSRRKAWPRSPISARSARFTTASSSPPDATACGSSTSTSRTSAFCSRRCCGSRPRAAWNASSLLMPILLDLTRRAADRIRAHRRGTGAFRLRVRAVRQPHHRREGRAGGRWAGRNRKAGV